MKNATCDVAPVVVVVVVCGFSCTVGVDFRRMEASTYILFSNELVDGIGCGVEGTPSGGKEEKEAVPDTQTEQDSQENEDKEQQEG